ncbi:hypothetical protein B6N13_19495 [Marinomonas sp. UCMA 3892]|uniref:hypothetical protein n=1 Tax=unclassified Marinomonas TaxID=196814 RepID=UPI0002F6251F|nr:hypothetical protein [Marinomonas sp. UCMA 3892]NLV00258.1 hypothetical protein [Marinomonas sp. UCMA 3892]
MAKLYPLIDSLIRIMLTIAFFYTFKHFMSVQNDLLLAFISVLCGFVTFRILMFAFNKITTKK